MPFVFPTEAGAGWLDSTPTTPAFSVRLRHRWLSCQCGSWRRSVSSEAQDVRPSQTRVDFLYRHRHITAAFSRKPFVFRRRGRPAGGAGGARAMSRVACRRRCKRSLGVAGGRGPLSARSWPAGRCVHASSSICSGSSGGCFLRWCTRA